MSNANIKGLLNKENDDLSSRYYYTLYTLLFLLFAFFVFLQFIINDKSFVFVGPTKGGDGLVQHYNAFVYYGQYLRQIVKTLFFEHTLIIPMWDMNIGFGQDIVSTLSYYVIGDPFSFLSVFFPVKYAETGYCALIVLRVYFAGLAFSYYCRFRGYKTSSTLVGTLIYCFCSFVLSPGLLHPFFILPLIYFPLLCVGVEKIIINKGIHFFSIIVGLTVLSNFYFSYMLCILVTVYMVTRCIESRGNIGNMRELFALVGKFLLSGSIGVCIGGVLLVPSLMNILTSSRLTVEHFIPLLYPKSFYSKLLLAFVSGETGYYLNLGFTSIGLFALTLLFVCRKRITGGNTLIASFILYCILSCIPFFGHVLNGFSYATNRWSWAFAALICYIIVVVLSDVKTIVPRDLLFLIVLTILMLTEIICIEELRSTRYIFVIISTAIFVLVALLFRNRLSSKCFTMILLGFCLASVSINGYVLYSPHQEDYLSNYDRFNNAHKLLVEDSPGYELKDINDNEFFRYDTAGIWEPKRNSSMQLKRSGTAYYFSSTAGNITQFNSSMKMNCSMDQSRTDLDRRSYLDRLFGVRYVIINNGAESYLPYGYDQLVKLGKEYSVYRSKSDSAIGVLFDQYMPQSKYEKLNTVEKQQALMQTVVVSDDPDIPVNTDIDYLQDELDYKVSSADGVDFTKDGYSVIKPNATLTLNFKPVSDCELYCVYERLDFEEDAQYGMMTLSQMQFDSGEENTALDYRTWKDNFYCGHKDFLVNVGYEAAERSSITIHFFQPGKISFKSMKIVSQPVSELDNYAKAMSAQSLKNLTIDNNSISGDIYADDDSVLLLQIPYSNGWTAEVDGKKTKVIPADELFMAVKLKEGNHSIVMHYRNHYLIIGSIISGFGILLLLISIIIPSLRSNRSTS